MASARCPYCKRRFKIHNAHKAGRGSAAFARIQKHGCYGCRTKRAILEPFGLLDVTSKTVRALRIEEMLARTFGDLDGADWLRQFADAIEAQARGSGALLPRDHETPEARRRYLNVVVIRAASVGASIFRSFVLPRILPEIEKGAREYPGLDNGAALQALLDKLAKRGDG